MGGTLSAQALLQRGQLPCQIHGVDGARRGDRSSTADKLCCPAGSETRATSPRWSRALRALGYRVLDAPGHHEAEPQKNDAPMPRRSAASLVHRAMGLLTSSSSPVAPPS